MNRDSLNNSFVQLGAVMKMMANEDNWPGFQSGMTQEEFEQLKLIINKQFYLNGWFTPSAVRQVLNAWGDLLTQDNLNEWTNSYNFSSAPKRVGVIMAGNIPLVGFHDFLSVLMSGHIAVVKLSSDDKTLLPALVELLFQWDENLRTRIEICPFKLNPIEAVIATGSNNSLNYFESYFGKYPHIFRKNRSSIAILNGTETKEELRALGSDIFTYFGLGCRNVSQLLIPVDFDLNRFFESIMEYADIVNHHKYANNYDYNRTILLMNQEKMLDNGFVLLRESDQLFSPLAMVYYTRFTEEIEVTAFIEKNYNQIQAIVGKNHIPFGKAQCPQLNDYADGVDTMVWLEKL